MGYLDPLRLKIPPLQKLAERAGLDISKYPPPRIQPELLGFTQKFWLNAQGCMLGNIKPRAFRQFLQGRAL
eukprot:232775-Karenia_brevis.AAC.1